LSKTPEIVAYLAHEARQHHVVHLGRAIDEVRGAMDLFKHSYLSNIHAGNGLPKGQMA
jgi:hypothetical protein